ERLRDQELKAERVLARFYRLLSTNSETIRAQRAQREAFAWYLSARRQEFLSGRSTLDLLLEAQRFWAEALANEHQAIAYYNNSIAGYEFAKGTIQSRHGVSIKEEPHSAGVEVVPCEYDLRALRDWLDGITPEKAQSLPAVLADSPLL